MPSEETGFASEPEPTLFPDLPAPAPGPEFPLVTVRQDDLRAVLAAAYDLCADREAFSRLAEAAGLTT
jgi:hypothetical protein